MSTVAERTTVALARVVADPYLWPREELHQGRVGEFMQLYRDGGLAVLPALAVVPDGERLLLADGWHRHQALTRLGSSTARVQMLAGDGDPAATAYRHGLRTASTAAMPLTREERRTAVLRLLHEHPELADREIARLVGVSPSTVGANRRRLQDNDRGGEAAAGDLADETVQDQLTPPASQPYPVTPGADELALRLARGLQSVWEARALSDLILGDRTGRRLAAALRAQHGDQALTRARRIAQWSSSCLHEFEPTSR